MNAAVVTRRNAAPSEISSSDHVLVNVLLAMMWVPMLLFFDAMRRGGWIRSSPVLGGLSKNQSIVVVAALVVVFWVIAVVFWPL